MSSSSSSDSDSEQKAKFKAAAIDVGTTLHMTAPEVKSFKNRNFVPPTRCDQRSTHRGLELDTTAEFRSFVAKKLYESLEGRIKFKKFDKAMVSDAKEEKKKDPLDWGFRLFSSSVCNSRTVIIPKTQKRVRSKSTSSDSDSRETLASVAVDLQTILDDRTMLNKFRVKEKVKSVEMDHRQQTEQSVQLSTDAKELPNAIPKKKKKKAKTDRKIATL